MLCVAARTLQRWAFALRDRRRFLMAVYLAGWLQQTTRRILASNYVHSIRANIMLKEEVIRLSALRKTEVQCVAARGPMELRIGSGLFRNGHTKYNRHLIAFDMSGDCSAAYPAGWMEAVATLVERLSTQKRMLVKIAMGSQHTVMVDDGSTVYTMGLGDGGQLGHGNRKSLSQPVAMEALAQLVKKEMAASFSRRGLGKTPAFSVKDICCGREHTILLTSSGKMWSWGGNRKGQLGHSGFESSALPRLICGEDGTAMKNVNMISCGGYHSACICDPGSLYTWGAGDCLGRTLAPSLSSSSSSLKYPDCSVPGIVTYFSSNLQGRMLVPFVVCGDSHVTVKCAGTMRNVKSGVELYAWGNNTYGQLGALIFIYYNTYFFPSHK